jgi:hypothetical protein
LAADDDEGSLRVSMLITDDWPTSPRPSRFCCIGKNASALAWRHSDSLMEPPSISADSDRPQLFYQRAIITSLLLVEYREHTLTTASICLYADAIVNRQARTSGCVVSD